MKDIRWTDLRGLGSLPAMKITLIGPFLPFIFELIDLVSRHPIEGGIFPPLHVGWPEPALTSLYFFYYGSTTLGVASLLYLLFCPGLVKRYASVADYVDREASLGVGGAAKEADARQRLKTEYSQADLSNRAARSLVFGCYVLGFVLVFAPACHRFWQVTSGLLQ